MSAAPVPTTRVTRTFAFLDLCGFTDYVDANGDDAAVEEVSALRAVIRGVTARYGIRVDKWLGDGAMIVGVDVEPVVAAVLSIDRLHREQQRLPLRGGLSTGPVIMCDGDDYVGRAVNLAARLCDVAGAGQILAAADDNVSLPAWVHATPALPLRIKGFARPTEVVALLPNRPAA